MRSPLRAIHAVTHIQVKWNRMKSPTGESIVCAGLLLALSAPGRAFLAQEGTTLQPVQPPAEVQVAQDFKKAAPDLFRAWLSQRSEVRKRLAFGHRREFRSKCYVRGSYFEFMDCADDEAPSEYQIDVTKTDSVLTPYLGHLFVPVKVTCAVRNATPDARSWSEEKLAALDPFCLGKTYEECISGGAKPASKTMGSACTGGPGYSFKADDKVHLTFRWSEGKWEFEGEKSDGPVPPHSGQY